MGFKMEGPVLVVSDLSIMKPHAISNEFEVVSLHAGVTRDRVRDSTGWPVRFADSVTETPLATTDELATLRDLHARTTRAHGEARA